jgi:hypothetical protein
MAVRQAASLVDAVLGSRDLVTRDGVGGDGEVGVLSAAAHRARIAVGEAGGQLGSHAVEPALTQVEQLGSGIEQGLVQAAPARCQLGCPTVVVLGGVDQGQTLGRGGDEQVELGDPGRTGGTQLDLLGQAIGLGLCRQHAGLRCRSLTFDVVEAGSQHGPPSRTRSCVLLVPGELGHGGVEVAHLLQCSVDLGVARPCEGTRGECLSGGVNCRARDLHLGLGTVGGRKVTSHGGRTVSGIEVSGALLVRGGVRGQFLQPGASPCSTLAQRRDGTTGSQRLGSGALSARGRVEGGHRRGHSCVQLTNHLGQQGAHRRVTGQWLIRCRGQRFAELRQDVLDPGQPGGERAASRVELFPGISAGLGEPGLDVAERADVEQPLQHLAAVLGGGAQEGGELALGQEHHLGELSHPHAEDVLDDVGHFVVAGPDGLPPAREVLLQGHHGLHGYGARTALLGPSELG